MSLATVLAAKMLAYIIKLVKVLKNDSEFHLPASIPQRRADPFLITQTGVMCGGGSGVTVGVSTYLVSFETLGSAFLLLLPDDNEGASVLVECKTHIYLVDYLKDLILKFELSIYIP
jgi:hypothetical protein